MSEQRNILGAIITKALQDEAFKQRLIADPAAVLTAEGIEISAGITLAVEADSESVQHLVLPAPGGGMLADSELSVVAGGVRHCYMTTFDLPISD